MVATVVLPAAPEQEEDVAQVHAADIRPSPPGSNSGTTSNCSVTAGFSTTTTPTSRIPVILGICGERTGAGPLHGHRLSGLWLRRSGWLDCDLSPGFPGATERHRVVPDRRPVGSDLPALRTTWERSATSISVSPPATGNWSAPVAKKTTACSCSSCSPTLAACHGCGAAAARPEFRIQNSSRPRLYTPGRSSSWPERDEFNGTHSVHNILSDRPTGGSIPLPARDKSDVRPDKTTPGWSATAYANQSLSGVCGCGRTPSCGLTPTMAASAWGLHCFLNHDGDYAAALGQPTATVRSLATTHRLASQGSAPAGGPVMRRPPSGLTVPEGYRLWEPSGRVGAIPKPPTTSRRLSRTHWRLHASRRGGNRSRPHRRRHLAIRDRSRTERENGVPPREKRKCIDDPEMAKVHVAARSPEGLHPGPDDPPRLRPPIHHAYHQDRRAAEVDGAPPQLRSWHQP